LNSRLEVYLAAQPHLAALLYLAASEIVDDFEDYGPVLQATSSGLYDESTAIRRLQKVRDEIISALQSAAAAR
jgi:hypothetical protein